jgi:hypothetical protein
MYSFVYVKILCNISFKNLQFVVWKKSYENFWHEKIILQFVAGRMNLNKLWKLMIEHCLRLKKAIIIKIAIRANISGYILKPLENPLKYPKIRKMNFNISVNVNLFSFNTKLKFLYKIQTEKE